MSRDARLADALYIQIRVGPSYARKDQELPVTELPAELRFLGFLDGLSVEGLLTTIVVASHR